LFTLGSFRKIAEVAHSFGLPFLAVKAVNYSILTQSGLGYTLGDFFHKLIWDRCYDFKNIFAEKFSEKLAVLTQNKAKF
jgi:hypothetical protein